LKAWFQRWGAGVLECIGVLVDMRVDDIARLCETVFQVAYLCFCTYARGYAEEGDWVLVNDRVVVVLAGCYEQGKEFAKAVGSYRGFLLTRC